MKIQTAPTQSFSEHAPSFNYRISVDTKGPINHPSHNKSYYFCGQFFYCISVDTKGPINPPSYNKS